MNHRYEALPACLLLFALSACTVPLDDVDEPDPTVVEGTADEVGESGEPTDPAQQIPAGTCLTYEKLPNQGFRHHCGGFLDATLDGQVLGDAINIPISYDFGPNIPGDTYQQPKVAACCGPYDFEQSASSQPAYWDNCIFDAVQQLCAALPYRMWSMAAQAKAEGKNLAAEQLNKLGNDLESGERQKDCLAALYGAGPEDLNILTDTQWNPVGDIWLHVDFLEVIEIALPEDQAEWLTCNSIFENDDTVNPDRDPTMPWKGYLLPPGSGSLQLAEGGALLESEAAATTGGALVLALDGEGAPVLGDLHVEVGALSLAGVAVERAGFGLLRQTPTSPRGDGSFAVQQPALLGAVVLSGEAVTTQLEPGSELVLRPIPRGWRLEAFALVYSDAEGQRWTVAGEAIDFVAP